MTKAFLFGKFYPFHKGHEAMIRFALEHCDWLTVLVCCSDRETIADTIRMDWIKATFATENRLNVTSFNYSEDDFPNTSTSSEAVSAVWATVFQRLFPDYGVLITSERYGDYVASFMGIRHISFDPAKNIVPVSASQIKRNVWANWQYLPDSVKPFYVQKIVVLGTESTGKTTLTQQLAAYFSATAVLEAGRDLIADSKAFTMADLYAVAYEHTRRIAAACTGDSRVIIIDTDIHITQSYATHIFQTQLDLPEEVFYTQRAGLYLYLNNDVAFVQDSTRLEETERNALDLSHRAVLAAYGIEYVEIKGDWMTRMRMAVQAVESYFLTLIR